MIYITEMNNNTKFIILIVVISLIIGGFSFVSINNANKRSLHIAQNILNKKLPSKYKGLYGFTKKAKAKFSKNFGSIAMLTNNYNNIFIIVEGPQIEPENIETTFSDLLNFFKNPDQPPILKQFTETVINNNTFPIFSIELKNNNITYKGSSSYLNKGRKTILFLSLSPQKDFKEHILEDFLFNLYNY